MAAYQKPNVFSEKKLRELSVSLGPDYIAELLSSSEEYLKVLYDQIYGRDPQQGGPLIDRAAENEKAKAKLDKISKEYNALKQQIQSLKTISTEIKATEKKASEKKTAEKELTTADSRLKRAQAENAVEGTEESAKKVRDAQIAYDNAKSKAAQYTPPKPTPKATGKVVTKDAQTARQGDVTPQPASKAMDTRGLTKESVNNTKVGPLPANLPSSKKPGKDKKGKLDVAKILGEAEFGIIDAVARQDKEIADLVTLVGNGDITPDEFRRRLRSSRFIATNSETVRQRITEKSIYNELTPEERASNTSAYAMGVNKTMDNVKRIAREKGASISDSDARMISEKLYNTGQEGLDSAVSGAILPYIKVGVSPVTGASTLGGEANANYQRLLKTASNNGISTDQIPAVLGYNSMDQALQTLATGEGIGTLENRLRGYAMTGQSDFVKNQLAQGVDLRVIAAPYLTAMSTVLELNPQEIKLNDPTLLLGMQNNGMNIFDYQRALKKDSRWQYTENANRDVADKTMRILQDFGLEA